MAVKTFDEIVQGLQLSADEKKLFDSVIAKSTDLKEGWLRQDDYSRKSNELSSEKKKFTEDLEYAEKMKAWADDAVPRYDKLVESGIIDAEGNELWTTQKSELEKQLQEAKAQSVGGDMDPAELDKRVKEIVKAAGGVTPEELKALITTESKKLATETFQEEWKAKETDFNTKTIPFVTGFSASVAVMANRYEKETGEKWTADKQKELFGMMSAKQNFDAFAFEEDLLKPHREKAARKTEIETEARKLASEMTRGMAGGGGEDFIPQGDQKGALQMALEKSSEGGDFESMIRSKAVEAAKALHQEGKV